MPSKSDLLPPRDSLELASLASSDHREERNSLDSSSAGAPSSRKLSFDDADTTRPGHGRTYSVSSTFDFNGALFPLTASRAGYASLGAPSAPRLDARNQNLEKNKSLTYLNGVSLVIGLVIGSGIFSSPASVNSNAGSPGAALIVWVISGVLAWTGASSYAELGGAIPLNGGAQIYLSKMFGEWAGFLFAWCTVIVLKPGSAAIIAIIFGEYTMGALRNSDVTDTNPWLNKGVAVLALFVVTLLNCISTRLGTRSADVFMFFKFAGLLLIAITGVVVAATGKAYDKSALSVSWRHTSWFDGTTMSGAEWAVAIYAGLWAYDGWDNTNFVVGEMINPGRDLPRTIHTSIPAVILAYLLANLAYIFVLPAEVINRSNTVAVAFGRTVFGPIGGFLLAMVVCASCFGSLNASTFTAGRLIYSAGKEGWIPAVFGSVGISSTAQRMRLPRRSDRAKNIARWIADEQGFFYTPIWALVLNMALTCFYIIIGDFTTLTTFYGVASYLFYFAAVVGLIILRVTEPHLERPYKCWITTPVIFCCVSLFLLSRAIFARPLQALVVLAFIVVGVPLYWWRVGSKKKKRGRFDEEQSSSSWKFWKRWTSR